ncbi:uncharacterized protein [Gossypium hirsutum]|uniref:Tf2-1-like SH3-like domain-containing protein n=1 Tax=Gossypium hirsutum TaxID=3635 RepID=A0A1U8JKM6_GOSHI|nr:uncharacterized protein LOC107908086 [Gossypium hirsutum]
MDIVSRLPVTPTKKDYVWVIVERYLPLAEVSQWKKVLRFCRKGKLSPRFIRPYCILKCVGPVVYQLELPPELDHIHAVFHVLMLRRYCSDPTHVVFVEEIEVRLDLTFEEELVQILERDVKVFWKSLYS